MTEWSSPLAATVRSLYLREIGSGLSRVPFMTDPNPNLDPDEVDEVEQANVAAAAIAGFTLAQFAFERHPAERSCGTPTEACN